MTICTFICPLRPAGRPAKSASVGRGRLRRYVVRDHLTDEERHNLREYYRRNHVQSPATMTAALGGHPFTLRSR
jgi:hypothetical protein